MYYCMFCGRQLEDGQVCDCEESRKRTTEQPDEQPDSVETELREDGRPVGELQEEAASPGQTGMDGQGPVYHQAAERPKKPSSVGIAFKNFFPFLKALVQKPANAVTSIAKHEDAALAAIYMVVFCLVSGLFFFGLLHKTYSIFGGKVNFFLAFFYGFLLAVILLAVTVVTAFIIGKVLHSAASFKKVFAVSAVPFVYPAICILLGCISLFFPLTVTVVFVVLAVVSWILTFYLSVKTLHHADENSSFFISVLLVLTAVLLLSGVIVQKYTGWAASHTVHEKTADDYFEEFYKYIK